jgi:hypothetical protein
VSDSVLTEILEGVSNDLLVFADISTIHTLNNVPIRNANVMYEIGLAHAVRMSQEVVLFRSDDDRLTFDLSNIRVNRYHPDSDISGSLKSVNDAFFDALKELDLTKSLAVQRARSRLDATSFRYLGACLLPGGLKLPRMRTVGDALTLPDVFRALGRLLDMGAIQLKWPKVDATTLHIEGQADENAMGEYEITNLGIEVLRSIAKETFGHLTAEQHTALQAKLQNNYGAGIAVPGASAPIVGPNKGD